jgi:hypothetical protein
VSQIKCQNKGLQTQYLNHETEGGGGIKFPLMGFEWFLKIYHVYTINVKTEVKTIIFNNYSLKAR